MHTYKNTYKYIQEMILSSDFRFLWTKLLDVIVDRGNDVCREEVIRGCFDLVRRKKKPFIRVERKILISKINSFGNI